MGVNAQGALQRGAGLQCVLLARLGSHGHAADGCGRAACIRPARLLHGSLGVRAHLRRFPHAASSRAVSPASVCTRRCLPRSLAHEPATRKADGLMQVKRAADNDILCGRFCMRLACECCRLHGSMHCGATPISRCPLLVRVCAVTCVKCTSFGVWLPGQRPFSVVPLDGQDCRTALVKQHCRLRIPVER